MHAARLITAAVHMPVRCHLFYRNVHMGLFNKTSNENESSSMATQQSPSQDQINLVGKGTVFEGTLQAESDVRASGKIIGTLRVTAKAMIAEEGAVEGEVIAKNADIAGRVQGEIDVEERLVLRSTAQVEGTIETERLVVEEGAEFTGECAMGGGAAGDRTKDKPSSMANGTPEETAPEEVDSSPSQQTTE